MSYPAISLTTATVSRHRHPQKRLQTAANLPSTRIRARIIPPVTPSPPFQCPHAVHPCPSVDSGLVNMIVSEKLALLHALTRQDVPQTMRMMQQVGLDGTDMTVTDLYPTDAPIPTQGSPRADLRINEVHVSNFRNIVDVRIPLESGATFLVGENNAGKSSFLLAIAVACGFHRATRDDLHQSDEGTAPEATIDLIIRSAGVEFIEAVAQRLNGNFGNGPESGEWTAIRTRLVGSLESSFLSARRSYLSWDASTRTWIETTRAPSSQVLELLAAHLVETPRDLSVDVLSRTSDWGRVLADPRGKRSGPP